MRKGRRSAAAAGTALVLGLLVWSSQGHVPRSAARPFPLPTEVAEGHDEGLLEQGRETWIESLHRASPGTDWRLIEKGNWSRLLRVRSQAALAPLTTSWTEVGSLNLAGRTHQSQYDASSGKLYVGAALGGVWRGDFNPAAPSPGTMNWVPISDNAYGGARGIVIFAGSPPTIVKSQYGFFSGEIHRSTDGGVTWSVVASLDGQIKRIVKSASSPTRMFALVRDPFNASSRLYRSTNSGASFQLLRTFASYEADIWVPRTGSGSLYLLTDNRIEVSTNQGTSWSIRGTLPAPTATRASLTGSEAGMPRLYAVAMTSDESTRRLLRSDDAGLTWSDKAPVTDFWGDHTSLAASSRNADTVLYGGLECWRSTDGGNSFQKINAWYDYYGNPAARLHADVAAIDFAPLSGNGEALFIGTDGGTYFSADRGGAVSNVSLQGLRVSQYYSTLSDAGDPTLVAGGSQDQGYQAGASVTGQFTQIISGDYGHLTSPSRTHQLVFSVYPGFVLAVQKNGDSYSTYSRDFPAGDDHYWMPPLAADPRTTNAVYLGATHLYRYELGGNGSWTVTMLPFSFQGQLGEVVSAVAIAPSNTNRWYVATNRGRFFHSSDAGANWTLSTFTSVPDPQYLTGLAIAVQDANPDVVALGGSGYSNPAVYLSTNGGVSFSALGTGQPQTLVTGLAWGPAPAFDLYAATESGAWRFRSGAQLWESLLATQAPMTNYWSVESAGGRMRFGTYGRGIWDFLCAAAPAATPGLTMIKLPGTARLDWTAAVTGTGYDVVRGDLSVLRSSHGDFTSSTTSCLANDASALTLSDASTPASGNGFWYLVRAMNCAGPGTYDAGDASQVGFRDAEIQASTAHCP